MLIFSFSCTIVWRAQLKSKSTFPLKISVFRVVRNVICSQRLTVFIIQGNGKTLFNWFVKFLRKNYANYVQNNFLLKLRRHSSLCIVRFSWFYCVSINYIYISITFTFQLHLHFNSFSSLVWLILYWYHKEKFCLGHLWELKVKDILHRRGIWL